MHATAGGKDIALGLTHFGTAPKRRIRIGPLGKRLEREAIEVFGRRHGAFTYRFWHAEGLCHSSFAFDFAATFNEAALNAAVIHFNLDGMDLRRAWKQGQFDYLDPRGSYAAWELRQILTRIDLLRKTRFWQNGQRVTEAVVWRRAGVTP